MIAKYARDLRTLPGDAVLGWRTDGWSGLGAEFSARTLDRAYRRARWLILEQDLDESPAVEPPAGIVIQPLQGDPDRLLRVVPARRSPAVRQRLEAGRICLLATRDGNPVGYAWVSATIDPAIETLPLALPNGAGYLWDLFVIRSERGGGVGSALASARIVQARRMGLRLGWRAISPDNRASLRTVEKTGASLLLGEITLQKIRKKSSFREVRYGDRPILASA